MNINTIIFKKFFNSLTIKHGCRTWALYPPIDIDEKHPNDKRTYIESYFYPFDILDTTVDLERASEEDKIRDVSGLKLDIKRKLSTHCAIPSLKYKSQLKRKFNRTLFGTFGSQSNINPAICWPTLEEVADTKRDEVDYGMSLSKMIGQNQIAHEKRMEKRQTRLKTIMENMAKMDDLILKFKQKAESGQREVEARREREAERLEEAREYFGYRISAHDPKYQTLMEEREASRKKVEKAQKKREKEQKRVARAIAYVGADGGTQNSA